MSDNDDDYGDDDYDDGNQSIDYDSHDFCHAHYNHDDEELDRRPCHHVVHIHNDHDDEEFHRRPRPTFPYALLCRILAMLWEEFLVFCYIRRPQP
jgi:hypothetical protein